MDMNSPGLTAIGLLVSVVCYFLFRKMATESSSEKKQDEQSNSYIGEDQKLSDSNADASSELKDAQVSVDDWAESERAKAESETSNESK